MKKYWEIARVNTLQYLVYRLNFILWRFRNIINLIFIFFLWTNIYSTSSKVFNYDKAQVISYVLVVTLASSIVLSSRTSDIATEILSGYFINYLLKPVSFFKYILTRELVDKLINIVFTVIEISLLVMIFKPLLFIQNNISVYPVFIFSLIIGCLIGFFISLSLSFIAFWSSEVWAPRFIFFMLVQMLAGSWFPLDVLPKTIYNFMLLTPFPYLIFFPTKIYIHGLSVDLIKPIIISIIWCLILFAVTRLVWLKGIKNYGAFGR
ncbi:MAG: hypothetical protein US11_C0004G0048 [Candidatus Roizmanbacteria bacterium GW2011_GWA2_36_23]|uniref:ABC-2 type transporter n=1 Tax=Candidatus Roizmanbacteria bacterium GW2011_GWA2_36_23 TaxID=1618480 RepID=A0A0G0E4G8_9BACT|nr:MAG: hypothetical protein US11_C0004G0048 [Candidatus Roizmanbacteria bacterium GW2011_GWA2_36_23]